MELIKQWIAYKTIVRREIARILRIWPQTIFPPVITTSLYFLIFGQIIGRKLPDIMGVPYLNFIIPGLIIMTAITTSYENTSFGFFAPRFVRSIEELIVSPTPNYIVVLGYISGGLIRGLISVILVYISAMCFVFIPIQHFGLMLLVACLAALIFSLCGFVNAVFAKNFDHVSWVPTFVLMPLTSLGGIFYNIHDLPGVWKTISLLNPLSYIINIFRYSILGITYGDIYLSLAVMLGLVMVLFTMACLLLTRDISIRA